MPIRGFIGVSIQDITPAVREALSLPSLQGALVAGVMAGQPAAKAGIKPGDVILTMAGDTISDPNELRLKVAALRPGQMVPVSLIRDGEVMELTMQIGELTPQKMQPPQPAQRPSPNRGEVDNKLGIAVVDINSAARKQYGIPSNVRGVVVVRIAPEVSDIRAQLRPGDVIQRARTQGQNWLDISSANEFSSFAGSVKPGNAVALLVSRGQETFIVSFDVEEQ